MAMVSDTELAVKVSGVVHTSYRGLFVLLEVVVDEPKYK
jgi:hypothetical protein